MSDSILFGGERVRREGEEVGGGRGREVSREGELR